MVQKANGMSSTEQQLPPEAKSGAETEKVCHRLGVEIMSEEWDCFSHLSLRFPSLSNQNDLLRHRKLQPLISTSLISSSIMIMAKSALGISIVQANLREAKGASL